MPADQSPLALPSPTSNALYATPPHPSPPSHPHGELGASSLQRPYNYNHNHNHNPYPHKYNHRPPPPPSAASSTSRQSRSRPSSLPFAFPPLFQPNTSSTSLVPSTAEGKPIPLDDSTAADRTTALRQLNTNYPSRHHIARTTGAQSSTYSQPVIVRTYSGPPSRPVSTSRSAIVSGISSLPAFTSASNTVSIVGRVLPFPSSLVSTSQPGNGMLSIVRAKAKKRSHGHDDVSALPPIDAFSFKSFMANMDSPYGGSDINSDLDRIAEICARSRYSLSNQYEVHVTPHGSGSTFIASSSSSRNRHDLSGPTLQAVTSDDERNMRRHRKRRSGGRRRSIAMGTLETIMSSSRSSDEDKSKKKSAAEIAAEVRGRASRKESGGSSPTSSSQSESEEQAAQQPIDQAAANLARKKSTSFASAVIENTRQNQGTSSAASPRSSATALISQPASPQTSSSHLEIRTASDETIREDGRDAMDESQDIRRSGHQNVLSSPPPETPIAPSSILTNLSGWIPWRLPSDNPGTSTSYAEGSLRELLKTTDTTIPKGKTVERR
jgi:hypothetical protein